MKYILTDLQYRIVTSIFLGGLAGFVLGTLFTLVTLNNYLIFTTLFGIIVGLLICIIIEINKIHDKHSEGE
ncbi:hypothetical protein [Tenuibacillus multivorans]|uniref:Uncharacterized protein n=1 Tax=Tenuibacillus multivorans TaxID=237069 RepID=A0A1H0AUD2_9BACI|nr:hypothetical protein [Tenuibacillus multivorans]GEL77829.1 hypothetical protein TMU01_20640 [Tenuibacillus multivorans]SDN36683.1 hypothetical protein SAMN05216498_2066 [Tenuibacillus multivorans]